MKFLVYCTVAVVLVPLAFKAVFVLLVVLGALLDAR